MPFDLIEPETVDEALAVLSEGDETTRPISGGSGLALMMKYGFFQPTKLVSLRRIARDLSAIRALPDGGLQIGATATLRDVEDSPDVETQAPMLHESLKRLATIRLRNVAQIGGAIAHGAPQMDLPPVLLALNAQVQARSRRGERWIPAENVFLGYYHTAIEPDELVTQARIPQLGDHRGTYRKVTARSVDDWPLLGIAVLAQFEGGSIKTVTAAVGAISDHAQLLPTVEASLTGSEPSARDIRSVAEDAADTLDYKEGGMASPAYQRRLVATNLRLALESVIGDIERQE
ncbi:MAG: hypothetical protein GEU79_08900 [Acidimicrobiia bacterium]|nr:hypothetical protein [Acidimicrobiia bacterium]